MGDWSAITPHETVPEPVVRDHQPGKTAEARGQPLSSARPSETNLKPVPEHECEGSDQLPTHVEPGNADRPLVRSRNKRFHERQVDDGGSSFLRSRIRHLG